MTPNLICIQISKGILFPSALSPDAFDLWVVHVLVLIRIKLFLLILNINLLFLVLQLPDPCRWHLEFPLNFELLSLHKVIVHVLSYKIVSFYIEIKLLCNLIGHILLKLFLIYLKLRTLNFIEVSLDHLWGERFHPRGKDSRFDCIFDAKD